MRQVEVSRTIVFDVPRRVRAFFEALIADNIGVGRPEEVSVGFARQVPKTTPGVFRTRVFTQGKLDLGYKRCRVKQYLKEGGRFASRPSSTTLETSASCRAWSICPSSSPRLARSTVVC
jgi:hypothetical protein